MADILQQLHSRNLETRLKAAATLQEQLANRAVPESQIAPTVEALMKLVGRETDDSCRATALMALCSRANEVSIQPIVELLGEFGKLSLIEALCLIGEAGDRAYLPTLATYLNHTDPDVRTAAAEAYAVLAD